MNNPRSNPAKFFGTRSERTAKTGMVAFDEFYETDFDSIWQWTGSAWREKVQKTTPAAAAPGGDSANNVVRTENQFSYELIPASATAEPLGTAGAAGDLLHAIIVKANTGTITLLDGAVTVLVIPASTVVGTRFEFNMKAATGWKITTPLTTEAIAIGRFT